MTKKILHFLLFVFFILTFSAAMAGEIYIQKIIKVNGISMHENAADTILENAKMDGADIEYKNDDDMDAEDIDIYIAKNYELMNIVIKLYEKAISNGDESKNVVLEKEKISGKEVLVYINKRKHLIDTLVIRREKRLDK